MSTLKVVNLQNPSAAEPAITLNADGTVGLEAGSVDTDIVSEGSANLYYTDQRVEDVIAASDTDDLSEGSTNLYYTNARVEDVIANSDTDDLAEGGTNLYFTDQRADNRIAAASIDDLADVAIEDIQDGDVLIYNGMLGAFENGTPPADLGDLDDVDVSGAVSGDVLAYDGAEWVSDSEAVRSADVDRIETISQGDYDLLDPADPNTMYIVI
jgi:hypothetical protein